MVILVLYLFVGKILLLFLRKTKICIVLFDFGRNTKVYFSSSKFSNNNNPQ